MKKVGIWIDKKCAKIVTLESKNEHLEVLSSEVEDFRIGGGSGTKFKGGPQDVVQDSKYLEREKHQLKSFFKKVITKIKTANELVIFGPAETNEKLRNELLSNYNDLAFEILAVKKADSMTDNQFKALVREFYSK